MRVSLVVSVVLGIIGTLFLLLALGAGLVSVSALVERMRYGPGIMFADVEFFGLLSLVSGVLGTILVISANKLSRWKP